MALLSPYKPLPLKSLAGEVEIYVNQSGKIEQTNFDTRVAAVKGDESFCLIIDKNLKRGLISKYKSKFKSSKNLIIRLFAIGAYLSIKGIYRNGDVVIIDNEYPSHGRRIIAMIVSRLKVNEDLFRIDKLGKKHPSHKFSTKPYLATDVKKLTLKDEEFLLKLGLIK